MSKSTSVWEMDLAAKSESTRSHYQRDFDRFLSRWEITADDLYDMRLADLGSADPRDRKRIERMVKAQMAEMKRQGLSASTCRGLNKAVGSFLEAQGLELTVKAKDKPKGEGIGKRMITVQEILTLWDSPGTFRLRNRAIAAFAKEAGLRVGDIAALDCQLYWEAARKENADGEPFRVFQPFETIKEGIIAHIRIGPEAVNALEAYMEQRRERGETLRPGTPLFPKQNGERLAPSWLSQLFQRWRNRCGLPKEVSAHSFRKFHTTMLQAGGVPDTWICKLQGKSTKTSFGVYSRPEELPGELTQAYMRAYDRLRIFREPKAEALEALRLRNEELARKLESRDERLTKVETRLDELVTLLDRLM